MKEAFNGLFTYTSNYKVSLENMPFMIHSVRQILLTDTILSTYSITRCLRDSELWGQSCLIVGACSYLLVP